MMRAAPLLALVRMLLLGVLAFGLGGCGSTPKLAPKRTLTIPLETAKTRTVINAKVGDQLTLQLPPVELPGFGWQIFLLDARFIKQLTEIQHATTLGERSVVTVFVMEPAPKTTMRFLLVKLDGSKVNEPVDGHDVVFSIQ